jgi:DNA-binding transcriptional LysR family regulator
MQGFPKVNIRVEYRHANLIYEDVLQGAADMGLVAYPEKQTGLEIIPYAEEKLVLATSPEHPLAKKSSISLKDLKGQSAIAFNEEIPTRLYLNEILEKADIDMPVVMEFDNIETIKRAVEINMGIAILPDKTIEREAKQGILKMIEIKDKDMVRPLAIIRKKDRVMQPGLKQFLKYLVEGSLEPVAEDEG